ncbi:hypothetical protein SLEP1_g53813 [Rubroshorea leprosula]|uniref:Endonuclease/exonuclease/phosphatase domain-containing protein n=1 Tax=Rubroshorea leprosula TaxID=152421 RepID=A0AAV5ME25_9ROSI|nr:hypothetical protein SLEP1_g53813 [Rubroshorea leprosula]
MATQSGCEEDYCGCSISAPAARKWRALGFRQGARQQGKTVATDSGKDTGMVLQATTVSGKDTGMVLQMYGRVVDVYLPSKRDKRGKRYGFVQLTGVKDEFQMERRLNEMWIGSYKMRVKIANARQRKTSTPRKVQGVPKVNGSKCSMNRLVQPGHSYAQAVKGQGKRADKVAEQLQEKEKEAAPEKEVVKTWLQENMDVEKTEETIEYTPMREELQWLEGGMVAVVRSMALVPEIQEQMDADGGSISLTPIGGRRMLLTKRVAGSLSDYMKHNQELFGLWFESIKPWEMAPEEKSRMMWVRISGVPLKAWGERCFQMIGETIGEVLMVHEDTKKKSILWDGRIEIIEEEWRSDPDWWLSENDRRSDLETESEYSNSWCQNEDQELDTDVMCDGEDSNNGSEHLMKDLVSISKLEMATVTEKCNQVVKETELEGEASLGLSEEAGPQRLSCVGLEENSGLSNRMGWGQIKEMSIEEPILHAQNQTDSPSIQKSENSKKVSKKQRLLKECYPESMEEIWAKAAPRVTPRTRQRQERREGTGQAGDEKVCNAAAVSISDGCIVNRNRVLQREMNMHEVRRMMGVGKRLGFNFENDEEEIQSKLLEIIDREGARRKDASGLGLGGSLKKKEVRRLVTEEKPDFLFLQETKLEKVDVDIYSQLWSSDELGWVAKGSAGASGGLLCIWDRRHFVKREEFIGDGFVGISGEWRANKQQYFLVNVYGPKDRQKKASLWKELRRMVTDKEGCWLIAGDFNAVREPGERRGRTGESPVMKDFDEFIVSTDLVDVKLTNRRYTWYKPDGTARSRLDRFLMSTEMSNLEGEWIQQGLPRNISDHCAIVLKSRSADWGPRPFRVLDAWQQHPDFKKFVEDKWKEMEVEGFAGYKCQKKLKLLKGFLKGWNKEVFGNMDTQYEQAVKKIEQVDMQNEISDLEDAEIVKRQEGFSEMWDVLRKKELIWKQKSRSKWVREGDANTRFFHRVAKGRRAHNNIAGLMCEGAWIDDPNLVKNEVCRYFRSLFQGESWNRPKPGDIRFHQISEEKKDWLERPFSVEEIEEGLRSCDGSKAPGPDGFNFNFLKFAWHCIKEDFINFFSEFHRNEGLQGLVQRAIKEGMLHGIEIGKKGLSMSLLQFADDTIIMGRADTENIRMVKDILKWFELMSGLRINFSKSNVFGYNVSEKWLKGSAGMLHCRVGKAPFLYLGLPVDGKFGNKKLWELVVNKFRAKLIVWKAATLSFGGRLILLNSVLSALPLFYMFLYLLPKSVLEELIRIQRNFLWGGTRTNKKISWVKWENVCRAKAKGGLGVPDLQRKNWAMLGKWWYRLGDGVESLWKKVVREKYYGGTEEVDITSIEGLRVSKLWRDIIRIGGLSLKLRIMLVEGFKWEGRWRWRVEWRRGTIGREKDEEELLEKVLEGVKIKKGAGDVWKWVHVMDGQYGVKLAYDFLASTERVLEDQMCKLIGCRLVPSKVAFFGWRLCLDRLPTKNNLQKRGILLQEGVLSWWGLESVLPNTVVGLAELFIGGLGKIVGKEMGSCIFLVVAWYLWYRRNVQVFRKDEGIPENLLERMQVKTFLWVKSKVNGCVFSFYEWQFCPMECAMSVKNHKRMRKQFYKAVASSS